MPGGLRGIFLGLLAVAAAIHLVVATWRLWVAARLPREARAAGGAVASRYISLATTLVGFAWLVAVLQPLAAPHGAATSYETLLGGWWGLLPMVVVGSAATGLLSARMGTARPLAIAFWLGMPTAMGAAFVWAAYILVAGWVPSGDAAGAADLARHAQPLLTIVTALPAAAFAAGFAGAIAGAQSRTSPDAMVEPGRR